MWKCGFRSSAHFHNFTFGLKHGYEHTAGTTALLHISTFLFTFTRMKTAIFPPNAAKPLAPYTPAIAAGGVVYLSGQIALDEHGDLHTGDIATETRKVMDNIGKLLSAAGLDHSYLVKVTIFLPALNPSALNPLIRAVAKDFGPLPSE